MSNRTKALVTGASSGIGAAFAAELAARGRDVVLVARRIDRLEAMAAELRARYLVVVEVIRADLAEPGGMRQVEARLEGCGDVDLLVNNAGIGDIAPFVVQERGVHEKMIGVNMTAPTRLAHAALPAMIERGEGAVINVASGFAFDYMPGAGVYAGTKAYLVQLTHVLAAELEGTGVKVQALVPGLTRTELGGERGNEFFDQFPAGMVMEPDTLVKASLAGLDLGERVCIPSMADASGLEASLDAIRAIGASSAQNIPAARYRVSP